MDIPTLGMGIKSSGVTSLNGARPLNSNGAPTKYKFFTVSKKQNKKKVATFFWFFL